ncbi:MAG: hypothetical protein ABI723_07100 [Bacteroidia bacterium]
MNTAKINSINTCCFENESNMRHSSVRKGFLKKTRFNRLGKLRLMAGFRKFYLLYEMEIMPLVIAVMFTAVLSFILNAIVNAYMVK